MLSQEASRLLQTNLLEDSLEAYQKAADCYLQQQHPTAISTTPFLNPISSSGIVAAVNAAGCFRNMGAVSRLLHNYGDAVRQLQCAEELYSYCRNQLWSSASTASTGSTTGEDKNEDDCCSDNDDDDEDDDEGKSSVWIL